MKKIYRITDVNYNHSTETLTWTYAGKEYNCTGEFYIDLGGYLHHTFVTPTGKEKEVKIKVRYSNYSMTKQCAKRILACNRFAKRPATANPRMWGAVKGAMERRYMKEWMNTPKGLYSSDQIWAQCFNNYKL